MKKNSINKLREMMRYKYDKFTGKIVNQNGDVAKSMDEAIRLNEKLDKDIPEEKVFEPILDRLTNRKLDPWQVDTWETMKKVAKDEARKNGNYGELIGDYVINYDEITREAETDGIQDVDNLGQDNDKKAY